jgi:hypothetical protein
MELSFKDAYNQTILIIKIIGKEESEGWLEAKVLFSEKGFKADFNFSLMLNNVYEFRDQLLLFYNNLKGEAIFLSVEQNVYLKLTTDGLGHTFIQTELSHNPASPKLSYVINSDQTFIYPLILECNQLIDQYKS